MTLADRRSHRARRSVRSRAKPGQTVRSSRADTVSVERRAAHGLPVSDGGARHLHQHPLFSTLIRRFGEFLFELDPHEKFLTAWTSRNALLQKRRAGVFGKHLNEVFRPEISSPLHQIVQSVLRENL